MPITLIDAQTLTEADVTVGLDSSEWSCVYKDVVSEHFALQRIGSTLHGVY